MTPRKARGARLGKNGGQSTAFRTALSLTPHDHDLSVSVPWSLGERTGLALLVALVPSILVLDYLAGRAFSLHLFYLLPVSLAAWNLGERAGYAIAAMSGTAWAFVAIAARGPDDTVAAVAWDVFSTYALFAFVAYLVARHRRFVDGLLALARLDADTGALSRRELDRVLEAEVRRSRRYRRHLAVAIFEFAETKGEAKGFLPAAVRAMRSLVREGDHVARCAPRRLAVVLIECRPPEPALVAARLRDALAENLRLRAQDLSICVATYAGGVPSSGPSVLAAAESHLQFAKAGGGVSETRVD